MTPNPRTIEQHDLLEWGRYLHEHGLVSASTKKTSLGYHAQINTKESPQPINEHHFSSADGQHVMLAFEDLKKTSIVGEFVFDVTETGKIYGEAQSLPE